MTSTTTSTSPTVAFFGATGGCANACLVHTLRAGYNVTALARSPDKLRKQLLDQELTETILDHHLIITQGNAKKVSDVKRALNPHGDGRLVSKVICGIGSFPVLQWSIFRPITLDDPNLCTSFANTLIEALTELQSEYPRATKPLFAYISTTGIASKGKPRDVPLAFLFFYRYMLAVPHEDKHRMEELAQQHSAGKGKGVFDNFVGVKASLLMGSVSVKDCNGLKAVRVGTEMKPAVGYTIKRADVGEWIFENVVKKDGQGWLGEKVTLTY